MIKSIITTSRKQCSPLQKKILFEFIEENGELFKKRCSGNQYTYSIDIQNKWEEITRVLNATPAGVRKSWKGWRKSWTDIKNRAKKKITEDNEIIEIDAEPEYSSSSISSSHLSIQNEKDDFIQTTKKQYSALQKRMLLQFMEENVELSNRRVANQYNYRDAQRKWEEIARRLNNVPGVKKSWKSWRKCWSDSKNRAKKRQAEKDKIIIEGSPETIEEQIKNAQEQILHVIAKETLVKESQVFESEISMLKEEPHDSAEDLQEQYNATAMEIAEDAEIQLLTQESPQRESSAERTKSHSTNLDAKVQKAILGTSIDISEKFVNVVQQKADDKRDYYRQKLGLLEKDILIKARIADLLEQILMKLPANEQE